jgi:pyruvate dehydrogenase E2 component (dihydrolipoamide acetyltransferase)
LAENGGSGDSKPSEESSQPEKVEKEDSPVTESSAGKEIDTSDIDAELILMPKMSDTMEEGVIASWLVKVGDEVSSGDILAEIETDKATMEFEAYDDGTVLYIGAEVGSSIPIDGLIAVIGDKNADFQKLIDAHKNKKSDSSKKEEKPTADKPKTETSSSPKADTTPAPVAENRSPKPTGSSTTSGGRIKASPLAKKMAEDKGYDLSEISGSGDNGRIVKKDIESFTPQAKPVASEAKSGSEKAPSSQSGSSYVIPSAPVGEESYTEEKVSQMRKVIAKRLSESKFTAPHFYLTMEIDMDKAIEARKSMNEVSPVKISFNDLVLKAAASALRQNPKANASWLGDTIRYNQHIHIGVAVAVEEGLLVPVVRFADSKSLAQISAEVKELGGKAKNKKLQPSDWEGNTFTISNLGMFGIEEFTAIVNPPDACIMAVGGIKQTPVVRNGEIKIGNVMKVTLSCDHRVVDGAVGSAFLQTFKQLLENPVRILI